MTSNEQWFRIQDSEGNVEYMRGDDYDDAVEQLVSIRRKKGQYRDVPERDTFLMLIGGPLNPIRVEVFELTNMSNGVIMEKFAVISEKDVIEQEKKKHVDRGRSSFNSKRFG